MTAHIKNAIMWYWGFKVMRAVLCMDVHGPGIQKAGKQPGEG